MKDQEQDKGYNNYIKYSGVAIQMAVAIGGFSYLGDYLDGKYETEKPYFTLILALFGVGISLYLLIKSVKK